MAVQKLKNSCSPISVFDYISVLNFFYCNNICICITFMDTFH